MFKNNNINFKQLKYYKKIIERNNAFHVQFLFVLFISQAELRRCALAIRRS